MFNQMEGVWHPPWHNLMQYGWNL